MPIPRDPNPTPIPHGDPCATLPGMQDKAGAEIRDSQSRQVSVNLKMVDVVKELQARIVDLQNQVFAHEFVLSVLVLSGNRDENIERIRTVKAEIEEAREGANERSFEAGPLDALSEALGRLEKVLESTSSGVSLK